MQSFLFLTSAATSFKKTRLFAALKAVRDVIMGPVDRLATAADVAGVLSKGERPAEPARGLAAPTGLIAQPLLWLVHLHWHATAPKRRVFRLFESLNHLS